MRRLLSERQALLIFDGAEKITPAELAALIELRNNCGVIVTSRRRGGGQRLDLRPLPSDDAADLLQDWGGEWVDNREQAELICEMVGWLPLAVELAGKYMGESSETSAEFLADLQAGVLAKMNMGERSRESVPVLLAKSIQQVSGGARDALAVTGLMALGPMTLEAVAAGIGKEGGETRQWLGELVRFGLLERGADGRYSVTHALIHTYARKELEAPQSALPQLVKYFKTLIPAQRKLEQEGLDRLRQERNHMVTLIDRCRAMGEWEGLLSLAYPLKEYLKLVGYWADWGAISESALSAARAASDESQEAAWLNNLGTVYMRKGEWERAIEMYEQSLETKERVGDIHGMAITRTNLALPYLDRDRSEEAKPLLARAFLVFQRLGSLNEETAIRALIRACGSEEAAEAYLKTFNEEK